MLTNVNKHVYRAGIRHAVNANQSNDSLTNGTCRAGGRSKEEECGIRIRNAPTALPHSFVSAQIAIAVLNSQRRCAPSFVSILRVSNALVSVRLFQLQDKQTNEQNEAIKQWNNE